MIIAETVARESYAFLQPIFEELTSGKYVAIDSVYESLAKHNLVNNIKSEQTKT